MTVGYEQFLVYGGRESPLHFDVIGRMHGYSGSGYRICATSPTIEAGVSKWRDR